MGIPEHAVAVEQRASFGVPYLVAVEFGLGREAGVECVGGGLSREDDDVFGEMEIQGLLYFLVV